MSGWDIASIVAVTIGVIGTLSVLAEIGNKPALYPWERKRHREEMEQALSNWHAYLITVGLVLRLRFLRRGLVSIGCSEGFSWPLAFLGFVVCTVLTWAVVSEDEMSTRGQLLVLFAAILADGGYIWVVVLGRHH